MCPVVFQGDVSNFKVTRDKSSPILTRIWRSQTVIPFFNDDFNDAQSLNWHRRGALLFFQGHASNFMVTQDKKVLILTRMMHKAWRGIEEGCIVLQGDPSNFKVTRDKTSPILTWIESFQTVTTIWINQLLRNDAQSLAWPSRCAL